MFAKTKKSRWFRRKKNLEWNPSFEKRWDIVGIFGAKRNITGKAAKSNQGKYWSKYFIYYISHDKSLENHLRQTVTIRMIMLYEFYYINEWSIDVTRKWWLLYKEESLRLTFDLNRFTLKYSATVFHNLTVLKKNVK